MINWYDIGLIDDDTMRVRYFRKRHEFEFHAFPSFKRKTTQKTAVWDALWEIFCKTKEGSPYRISANHQKHELLHEAHRVCTLRRVSSLNGPAFFRRAGRVLDWMGSLGLVKQIFHEGLIDDVVRPVHVDSWERMLEAYQRTPMGYKAKLRTTWMEESWRRARRAPDWDR